MPHTISTAHLHSHNLSVQQWVLNRCKVAWADRIHAIPVASDVISRTLATRCLALAAIGVAAPTLLFPLPPKVFVAVAGQLAITIGGLDTFVGGQVSLALLLATEPAFSIVLVAPLVFPRRS